MSSKFIRIKRVIVPIVTFVLLTSQISGCATVGSKEMTDMINSGQVVTIEVAEPSYEIKIQGEKQEANDWVQLDQLKTYNEGFRQGFDEVFNINIVTVDGVHGKEGVLFVDEEGDRNGNTTLEDALRNRIFVKTYWEGSGAKERLAELANKIYVDTDGTLATGIAAAINAYYNLLPDSVDPTAFNPTQSLTREEFYSLVFKTEECVQEIEVDKEFELAIGGATKLSRFAQGVAEYGFLQTENSSLDGGAYGGSISRAEAIYLMVNKHFPDELEKVTGKEKAFKDTKNAGDLALKAKFKERNKETKEIVEKERWQAYTLAYMVQNPSKGMQEELYKAMVVAKNLGLVHGEESRWDEPLSKAEAIQLIVNTHLAKNELYGFISDKEYGNKNPAKFTVGETMEDPLTGEEKAVVGVSDDGLKFGLDWAELPPGEDPIDGNTLTRTGDKIGEAKLVIMEIEEILREAGYTEEEIEKETRESAKLMGTTIEELQRVNVELPKSEGEATVNNGNSGGGTSNNKGGSSSTGNKSSGGSQSGGNKSSGSQNNSGNKSSGGGEKLPDDIHGTPGVISDAFKDSIGAKDHEGTSDWENDTGILE